MLSVLLPSLPECLPQMTNVSARRPFTCTGNAMSRELAKQVGVTDHVATRWNAASVGWQNASEYAAFVENVAPLVAQTYLANCGIQFDCRYKSSVGLHLRCSDVPFVRNKQYHLVDPSYWLFVLSHLHEHRAPKTVVLFNSSEHHAPMRPAYPSTSEQHACDGLAAAVGSFFRRHNYTVRYHESRDSAETIAAMLGVHTLVASMASSFSFFAGITKPRERYLTPEMYREEPSGPADENSSRPAFLMPE